MTETRDQAGGTTPATWDCTAYGPTGREVGAWCFFSEGARECANLGECRERMTAERQRVFDLIQAGANAERPDPVMVMLAEEFTSPDQLLNGEASEDER